MADEANANPAGDIDGSDADPIKNIKAEMERKFSNITKQLQTQNEQLMQAITQVATPKKAPQKEAEVSEDLVDLMYSDPGAYARRIAEMATSAATKQVSAQVNRSNEVNTTLQRMVSEYPELNDQGSEMYQKAIEIYNTLSEDEKQSASGVKLAIREAAADLGVVPVSKRRRSEDDDFNFGGNVSDNKGSANNKRKQRDEVKVSEDTLAFAQLLGRNIDDPKVKAGLEKASKRKDYGRYR